MILNLNYVKKESKEVEVYAFKELTSVSLINSASKHVWIDKKTTNKFFYRGKKKNIKGGFSKA